MVADFHDEKRSLVGDRSSNSINDHELSRGQMLANRAVYIILSRCCFLSWIKAVRGSSRQSGWIEGSVDDDEVN